MKGMLPRSIYVGISKPTFSPGRKTCKGCKYYDYRDASCIGMHQRVCEIKKCPIGGISMPRKLIREWKPTFGLVPQKSLAAQEVCAEAE